MKAIKIIPLIIFLSTSQIFAQSIVIGAGAEMNVTTGADVCATTNGNVTGNLTGTGTQCNQAMPVEMMTFSASAIKTSVILVWQTSFELNNKGFEIIRSGKNNNTEWNKIGFVNGSGTKTTPTNYSYTDDKLSTGKYYYRLKQIDNNGNMQYYYLNNYIEITPPNKFELLQNYPNPFNPITKINFSIPSDTKVSLKIYDVSGREVSTLINNKFLPADIYTVEFNASTLASGVYFYRIVTDKFTNIKKMVVIK